MDVNDFNLIIGEQATGKSTIAKAVYYFRHIKTMLTDYLCQLYDAGRYNDEDADQGFEKAIRRDLKYVFVSLFGYSWELDKKLSLKYYYTEDRWISIRIVEKSRRYKRKFFIRIEKAYTSAGTGCFRTPQSEVICGRSNFGVCK